MAAPGKKWHTYGKTRFQSFGNRELWGICTCWFIKMSRIPSDHGDTFSNDSCYFLPNHHGLVYCHSTCSGNLKRHRNLNISKRKCPRMRKGLDLIPHPPSVDRKSWACRRKGAHLYFASLPRPKTKMQTQGACPNSTKAICFWFTKPTHIGWFLLSFESSIGTKNKHTVFG